MGKYMETLIKKRISPQRWSHSLRVAEAAEKLALFWGFDPEKFWLAGILHDFAREIPLYELINIAAQAGHQILPEEKENPVVLHAPVGAFLVQRDLSITDPEILKAISHHTVGGCSMSFLDKIIFLADLIEPGRKWLGVDRLRKLAYQDINKAMLEALDGTIEYLRRTHQVIHPNTIKARKKIRAEILALRRWDRKV
jgi:predicted HD superfamily hydrolase involved in NAD metabolism